VSVVEEIGGAGQRNFHRNGRSSYPEHAFEKVYDTHTELDSREIRTTENWEKRMDIDKESPGSGEAEGDRLRAERETRDL